MSHIPADKFPLVLGFLLITCNLMHQALRCSFNALDPSKIAIKILLFTELTHETRSNFVLICFEVLYKIVKAFLNIS